MTEVEVEDELEDDDEEEEVDEDVLEGVEEVEDVLSVGGLVVLVEGDGVLVEVGFPADHQSGQWLKVNEAHTMRCGVRLTFGGAGRSLERVPAVRLTTVDLSSVSIHGCGGRNERKTPIEKERGRSRGWRPLKVAVMG